MIRLSNLADYAVVVMTAAAKARQPRLSAAAVALTTGIPEPTVAKLMSLLSRSRLLVATRGAAGGYELARPAERITVTEIVEAVDGPIALTQCLHGAPSECGLESACAVRPHWPIINRSIREALSAVTLAELAGAPAPALVEA